MDTKQTLEVLTQYIQNQAINSQRRIEVDLWYHLCNHLKVHYVMDLVKKPITSRIR